MVIFKRIKYSLSNNIVKQNAQHRFENNLNILLLQIFKYFEYITDFIDDLNFIWVDFNDKQYQHISSVTIV